MLTRSLTTKECLYAFGISYLVLELWTDYIVSTTYDSDFEKLGWGLDFLNPFRKEEDLNDLDLGALTDYEDSTLVLLDLATFAAQDTVMLLDITCIVAPAIVAPFFFFSFGEKSVR